MQDTNPTGILALRIFGQPLWGRAFPQMPSNTHKYITAKSRIIDASKLPGTRRLTFTGKSRLVF